MGKNITVLGAGAWGTAFGQVLADAGNTVTMWAKEQQIVEGIRDHHHNAVRLPSAEKLPDNMTATGDRAEAVKNVKAANQVTFNADQRVTDLFAKSGTNVDSASKSTTNVAKDADVTGTTYAEKDTNYPAKNAVDGKTVMESFWGTKGSENKTDTLNIKFKDGKQKIDDIRLYFYQSSSSQTISGYAEPANYKLEYQKDDGTWAPIADQVRTPNYAGANYNRIQWRPRPSASPSRRRPAWPSVSRRSKPTTPVSRLTALPRTRLRRWMLTCLPAPHLVPSSSVR